MREPFLKEKAEPAPRLRSLGRNRTSITSSPPEADKLQLAFPACPSHCPQEESNLHRKLRKLAFYPLNYGDTGQGGQVSIVRLH